MGGKGGDTPCPSKKNPERQTLLCSRPPLWTLRGDERSGTKPPGFGHGEQKVPAGSNQAVLPVLPQALQPAGVPNSSALWCSAAPSTLHLVRALGSGSSLELGRGEGPSPRRSARGGWIWDVCPSLSCPSQGYKLPQQRGTKPPPSAAAGS